MNVCRYDTDSCVLVFFTVLVVVGGEIRRNVGLCRNMYRRWLGILGIIVFRIRWGCSVDMVDQKMGVVEYNKRIILCFKVQTYSRTRRKAYNKIRVNFRRTDETHIRPSAAALHRHLHPRIDRSKSRSPFCSVDCPKF